MSITTVELFHRMGRRARGGDFTKLSMSEQTDLAEAANTALQRLYNALPTYFKEQTQGFVLPAPLAVTAVGVTQFGKTVTGLVFTAAQFGQTIVLDGDPGWNQIIGTDELLNPYMGATGSVNGTIYGNAIYSETYPFDRVIGNPQFASQGQGPYFTSTIAPMNTANPNGWWWYANTIGVPQGWWPQVFGNSQKKTPLMVLRFAPAPSQAFAINVRLGFWPKRITLADYEACTSLGVPDQFIETSLIPMCVQALMTTPVWQRTGDEDRIEMNGDKGELFARNQLGQVGAPNNRVGTPRGY